MHKDELEQLFTRGVAEGVGIEDLKKRIAAGEKLRVKLGIDPTSPDIHIGHAVSLMKLRDFQKLGHKAVLIVGDFTAVIGDTSDKDSERPMLDRETIEENKKSYFEQVGKIIDLDSAELLNNSEWLEPLGYREIGEHANQFSVADFISRDNIRRRLDEGKRVSLREVLYPLMQAYDSVAVRADMELGGQDQWFNLLAGRTLQEHYGQKPQAILTAPLIPGLDGRKMSKSFGNSVSLNDSPSDMYGKIMSLSDENVPLYFEFCTRVPFSEVEEVVKAHPKEAKMRLAREIVKIYHGEKLAKEAEDGFVETFSKGGTPKDVATASAGVGEKFVDILIKEGIVESKSEWRRLVEDGAVTNMERDEKVTSLDAVTEESVVLRIGKHRFLKIEVK